MSNNDDKLKNSSRRYADQVAIEKQVRIAKDYHMHQNTKWKYILQPHRNHKMHILNCGNSKCYMCGNPRRWFKETTIQEKKFFQHRLHQDDSEQ
jgi:serine/threonine protein phosphatase PrpC